MTRTRRSRKPHSNWSNQVKQSLLGKAKKQTRIHLNLKKFYRRITAVLKNIKKLNLKKIPKLLGRKILQLFLWPFTGLRKWFTLSFAILATIGFVYLLKELPSPTTLTSSENYAVSTQIFDRNGTLLYEIFADENRIPVKLSNLPDHVKQATIAIEDKNFYRHFGFDIRGIVRAGLKNTRGERVEGGSTITQQLVKNALLTREKTFERKFKELFLSIITEVIYSKEEILEMYLNYIPYGGTAVGIEAAAQQYFNKSAQNLSLAEASLLAGLPQAPSRYSPFQSDQTAAKNRQAEVLRRMAEDGYITFAVSQEAQSNPLIYALDQTDIQAPHFVFYVRDLLVEKYGVDEVEKGGLRVTTSLDLTLQNTVQEKVKEEIDQLANYRVSNGAALIIKPQTGEVLSMVGSRDYFDVAADGQVNVTLAQRQPGSSIKPIMYSISFQEKVLNPGTILMDTETCFEEPGQKPYCPKNYDGTFKGPVTVRQSLGNSLNIPAVKSLKALGVEKFIEWGNKMGISSWQDPSRYGLSLTLGGGEVRMIDLAQAFAVLADQGVKVPINPILKIEDYRGNLLYDAQIEQKIKDLEYLNLYEDEATAGELTRVLNRAPAYLASHIMQDNTARSWAFGTRSQLVIPDQVVSVKTGTTNNLKDNWTVGFTPEFLVATWVGNNNGDPMNPYLVSGVTGAAPIWNQIMSHLLKDKEPVWQEKPPDVKSENVCYHGMPLQDKESCQSRGKEFYWTASVPSNVKIIKQQIWIDPETGAPPPPDQVVEGLVIEEHSFYQDPYSDELECMDCVIKVEVETITL
ncbi:MAG TPA: transglycosylase domain-containing protein [Candidatus Woesebacteria bacterium]|nr:transglycosylase domain-containing protein [Candidatus Woesebacteria bacterium]